MNTEARLAFVPELPDWPEGEPRPPVVLAVCQTNPAHFREFPSEREAGAAGYCVVTGSWVVCPRWESYQQFIQRCST